MVDGRTIGWSGGGQGEKAGSVREPYGPQPKSQEHGVDRADIGEVNVISCTQTQDVGPNAAGGWKCEIDGRTNGFRGTPEFQKLDIENAETRGVSGQRGPNQIDFVFPSGGECWIDVDEDYSDLNRERTLTCR
jgi:hypothetical protein